MTTAQQATLDADLAQQDERLRVARAGFDDDVAAAVDKLSDGYGDRLRHGHPLVSCAGDPGKKSTE